MKICKVTSIICFLFLLNFSQASEEKWKQLVWESINSIQDLELYWSVEREIYPNPEWAKSLKESLNQQIKEIPPENKQALEIAKSRNKALLLQAENKTNIHFETKVIIEKINQFYGKLTFTGNPPPILLEYYANGDGLIHEIDKTNRRARIMKDEKTVLGELNRGIPLLSIMNISSAGDVNVELETDNKVVLKIRNKYLKQRFLILELLKPDFSPSLIERYQGEKKLMQIKVDKVNDSNSMVPHQVTYQSYDSKTGELWHKEVWKLTKMYPTIKSNISTSYQYEKGFIVRDQTKKPWRTFHSNEMLEKFNKN